MKTYLRVRQQYPPVFLILGWVVTTPEGSPQAFLPGLAHLSNLLPYQCRAQHAGHCDVAVAGGRVSPADGLLNLPIPTAGGFRCAVPRSTTHSAGIGKIFLQRPGFWYMNT
jgi:hypothetical protein